MTTAIFTNIGGNIGSSIVRGIGLKSIPFLGANPLSSFITSQTRAFGAEIGRHVSGAIFGVETINTIKGPRLNDLAVQTSTYGDVIPIVFGRVKIAGNIIWAQPIREIPVTTTVSGGGKGGATSPVKRTQTSFMYKATFAVALCEGEISDIERVWADNDPVNLADHCASYTIYNGDEGQLPDPIMESFEGVGNTPAYRGMAYVVFEDFDLNSFGNRIPNLSFEVNRPIKGSLSGGPAVEDLVTAISLIPGSGEFVYDTVVQEKVYGVELNGSFIQRGGTEVINMNNSARKADALVSIDQLGATFPNLEWVSVICTWFTDSLDAATATVAPRVEYKDNTSTRPDVWACAGLNRNAAIQVTLDENNSPIYGGTPSDSSVVRLVEELKQRGYKVMFYPMVFIDQPDKPWRGRMTAAAEDIANFFTRSWGYNQFIMHYANLMKDRVDAFVIGSEMKGLTQVNDDGEFPAVDEFVSLAASVKTAMPGTKITYAADWSEYHSTSGWYNMDKLWASDDIDFIGIDAYFPLTDRPQQGIYNVDEVIEGWESGEGYDWYYADDERTEQQVLAPSAAWKNIEWWWNNTHTNPNLMETEWVPGSKKIWFTEFGFPSVDGATNQPNVFYNPASSEGALPHHSEGYNDLTAQRLGIEATLLKWQESPLVEEKFLWTWDARPYPFWPDLMSVWGDGLVWSKGHWVNGKLGGASVAGVIKELCLRSNISVEELDVSKLQDIADGYVINHRTTASSAIEKLSEVFFFTGVESDGVVKFTPKGREQVIEIAHEEMLHRKDSAPVVLNHLPENYMPTKLEINFISRENNYTVGTTADFRESRSAHRPFESNVPLVLTSVKARNIATISLAESWASGRTCSFFLPYSFIHLDVGDAVEINDEIFRIEKIGFSENGIEVEARSFEPSVYGLLEHDDIEPAGNAGTVPALSGTQMEVLDISAMPGDDLQKAYLRFAVCGVGQNWQGAQIFYSTASDYQLLGNVGTQAVMGKAIAVLPATNCFVMDENNEVEVYITGGQLSSVTTNDIMNGTNIALLGDEIIQFREAEFVEAGRYRLKGLLRGRFGTENMIDSHEEGERFVLLDSRILKVEIPKHLIGAAINIKVVSFGQNINDVQPVQITYRANNLMPYAPVWFKAVKNDTGDIYFSWVRRSREFSNWRDHMDIPLSEISEGYIISILDDMDVVVRQVQTSDSYYNYPISQQEEDFGSGQSSIKAIAYQHSENMGRGFGVQKTFGF